MKTVSFQGIQPTANQRRMQAFQQQARAAFMPEHLQKDMNETFAELDRRKAQGIKPERLWFLDSTEKGTPYLGDVFGY